MYVIDHIDILSGFYGLNDDRVDKWQKGHILASNGLWFCSIFFPDTLFEYPFEMLF